MTADNLRQLFEGQLCKYTNFAKGWQFRWFVLDPEAGVLDYYVNELDRRQRNPRGSVHLAAAVISPSDEDSNTFTVNSATGDQFKLRAIDARERHEWVSRIRAVAEMHTNAIAQSNPPLPPREHVSTTHSSSTGALPCSLAVLDAFSAVRDYIHKADHLSYQLGRAIEDLPSQGASITNVDAPMLMLKATAQATVTCLAHCLSILLQQQQMNPQPRRQEDKSSQTDSAGKSTVDLSSDPARQFDSFLLDEVHMTESPLELQEEDKSVILSLCSQLKRGMDLTRVTLPTFILEKRSLLEMFSDFLGHPQLFIKIPDETLDTERMLLVLEWFLTAFHIGKSVTVAKKPYNPIIGENFHCCWKVETTEITFSAEQVSHHPPVTAFYVECPQKNMYLNASLWTKSNYAGMSVGVNLIGEMCLTLGKHNNEQYFITLPSAYGRSIISTPWLEIAGKATITCPNTNCSATVIFQTKPFYGGKLHQVTAEAKNAANVVICRVTGEWDKFYEFTYPNNTRASRTIELSELQVYPKRVRKLSEQGELESRNLWHMVTEALLTGDLEVATTYKSMLERKQREEEKQRRQHNMEYTTRYFHKDGENWIFKYPRSNLS